MGSKQFSQKQKLKILKSAAEIGVRENPQAFGLVGGEAEAVTASQRVALDSGFISSSPLSGRSLLRRRPICG
jgi:hypothetical protein